MTDAPELPPEELREFSPNHNPFHNYVTMDGRLTSQGIAQADFALRMLAHACFVNSKAHGWYDEYIATVYNDGFPDQPVKELQERNFGEVIALIHSELSEALESYRDGEPPLWFKHADPLSVPVAQNNWSSHSHNDDGVPGKPEGVASELADVLIRVFDYVGAYDIPLADALIAKHAYNVTRPYRHGNKKA